MPTSHLRLAVFTSQLIESFVLTEIVELQRRVEALIVVPVWPDSPTFHGDLTHQVDQSSIRLPVISPMILGYAVVSFLRSPGRVGRALAEIVKGGASLRVLMKNLVVFPKAVYVARLIQQFGAHHIHAHWASVPATMALVVSRLTGVPWSFTAHRWDIAENNLLRPKIRTAVFGRVVSLNGRDKVLTILGENTCSNLLVIHMGTTLPDEYDTCFAKNSREFRIACIGNLLEVKGHRYLIQACKLLRQRGLQFVCHIIGGGPLRRNLETLVHHLGLEECVQFRGSMPHDEVIRVLQRREIDVVVHPSIETPSGEHEGIPVALMEALANRVPAISTESGGIPELLGDGAGVLVKPGDPNALADAIQRVMEDFAYRASLVETGFAKVSADFNIHKVADRLVALMEAHGGIG